MSLVKIIEEEWLRVKKVTPHGMERCMYVVMLKVQHITE